MPITRPLAALFLAAATLLAGCASGDVAGDPDGEVAESPGGSESAAPGGEGQLEFPEPEVDDVPEVVAEVNGDQIGRDEFIAAYEGQLQQAFLSQQGAGQEIDQSELKQQVANQLVNNRVLAQAAEDAGITASADDVEEGLESLAAQNGLAGAEEALAALEEQGISEEVAREDVARQYQISTFLERESKIEEPGDDELRAQYDALVEQMEAQGQEFGPDGEVPPFEEVRDVLAEQATREQQNAEANRVLDELLKDVDVTIHL